MTPLQSRAIALEASRSRRLSLRISSGSSMSNSSALPRLGATSSFACASIHASVTAVTAAPSAVQYDGAAFVPAKRGLSARFPFSDTTQGDAPGDGSRTVSSISRPSLPTGKTLSVPVVGVSSVTMDGSRRCSVILL